MRLIVLLKGLLSQIIVKFALRKLKNTPEINKPLFLRFSALSTSDNFSHLGLTACASFFRIHSLLEALRFSTLSTSDNFSLLGLTVCGRFFRIYFLLEALRFSALSTSDNFSLLGLTACARFFCLNYLLVVL